MSTVRDLAEKYTLYIWPSDTTFPTCAVKLLEVHSTSRWLVALREHGYWPQTLTLKPDSSSLPQICIGT